MLIDMTHFGCSCDLHAPYLLDETEMPLRHAKCIGDSLPDAVR